MIDSSLLPSTYIELWSIYYKSAPSWLKAFIILSAVYISYQAWSKIVRTRREFQAASWILSERRRVGIPDSDKRPFKIAKAAAEEASRKTSSTTQATRLSSPANHESSSSQLQPQPTTQTSSRKSPLPLLTLSKSSNLPSCSSTTSSISPVTVTSQETNIRTKSGSSTAKLPPSSNAHLDHLSEIDPSDSASAPIPETKKSNRMKPASSRRTCSLQPPAKAKPSQPLPQTDKTHQKRVAPLSTDGSDSSQSEGEPAKSISRNRKKAKTQNEIPSNFSSSLMTSEPLIPGDSTRDPSHDLNKNNQPENTYLRKKRILSDCVGESDADQASRIKKGRSERTSDLDTLSNRDGPLDAPEDLMQIDQGQEDHEDQPDEELYMIADDGQKKKLVKIRSRPRVSTPESDSSLEEINPEQRWVTHREFRHLKHQGKLVLEDDEWDSESTTSSSDTLDYDLNRLSTPTKQTSSALVERGPIWSIEGKPLSNTSIPASEIIPRTRPVSRPRNSLGRMRLSLPPDPASPLQRSRSHMLSALKPPNP